MGLFQPAWMSDDIVKARKGLAKVNDIDTLCKVAVKAPNSIIRDEAMGKIGDPQVLYRPPALGASGYHTPSRLPSMYYAKGSRSGTPSQIRCRG